MSGAPFVTRLPVTDTLGAATNRLLRNPKIAAPTAHRHAVERVALLKRIFGPQAARLVVFQGPAGHGKTSLMLQALEGCRQHGMLTGWISLDESDNDLSRFLGHVHEMVAELRAEVGATAPLPAIPAKPAQMASRTDWLVDELRSLGRPVAVFIDDLHLVSSRSMISFLRDLFTGAPDGIRWFLASRVVPEIGLPRMVVGDQALVIRPEELRFSKAEIGEFFHGTGEESATDAEVTAIHAGTEGWPAAVQLYRLAFDSPAVRESLRRGRTAHSRELADYLADNVLARQEPRVQEFLLKTSVLNRMSVPLCNAVLGRNDSGEILSFLERTGLFVRRIESEDQWWTYHALFSRFLQDHLDQAYPECQRDLHRRAARWHRKHLRFEEALHHFSTAGDHAEAADVFEIWSDHLVPAGHMVTVDRWSDSVPMEELEKRPGLLVRIVWALTFLSRHRKLAPLLPLLRSIAPNSAAVGDPRVVLSMVNIVVDDLLHAPDPVEGIDTSQPGGSQFRSFELSAVENARGYHAMAAGHYDDALQHFARGRALSDPAGATFALAASIGKSALTLLSQGRLQEAVAHCRTALTDTRLFADESISTAILSCSFIAALYEADEHDLALSYFRQFRDVISSAGFHDYLVISYRAIARIHDLRGQHDEALAMLEEAEQLAYLGQWPRAVRLLEWERVRREILAGRIERAKIIASRFGSEVENADTDWIRLSEDSEDVTIGRIRLLINSGKLRDAMRVIETALRKATVRTRVHRQIKLHVLAALAHRRAGDDVLAHRSLGKALSLAAPGGYVRAVIDEGEEIYRLLLEHARPRLQGSPSQPEVDGDRFLVRLIAAGDSEVQRRLEPLRSSPTVIATPPATTGAAFVAAGVQEDLTERERKILAMLVDCLTNDQIARNLCVTRDAVKYHLKNIYAKLGVKSRLEAIRALKR